MSSRAVGALLVLVLAVSSRPAWSWGEDGHSIVAEIAQRRLAPDAAAGIERLLGGRISLASISSWADDERSARPETARWHYVDIPLAAQDYDPARDCAAEPGKGDCAVRELERARREIACAPTLAARRDALRFAVHIVGDLHQPLHAVGDARGGNQRRVHGIIHGATCRDHCEISFDSPNLHVLWDTMLIHRATWDWGAYVERLEAGLIRSEGFEAEAYASREPRDWAVQSHEAARAVWNERLVPADGRLDDGYYEAVRPILDRQLALAGLRLARYLDEAFAVHDCGGASPH